MTATPHVIIAGAGPVGLTAALVIAQAGLRVTVLERGANLSEDLRASTWHPPTLDMLDTVDPSLARSIIDMGLIARYTNHHDRRDGLVASFDMELLRGATNHPYRVQCEQWKYTRLVGEKLRAYPDAKLVFEANAQDVTQNGAGVTLRYATPDGVQSITGDYLIAADGSRSALRQAVGIEFEGFTYPERFYVASTAFDFAPHIAGLSLVNYISDPQEWCVLLRVRDLWRVLFPTGPDESDADVVSDASTEARLQGVWRRDERYQTVHRTIYQVHERVAQTYRAGRVFLAGDSAHINNPLGGMGMNGGMHDGFNLAQKLAKVLRGEAPAALLDRYERQRRPIAIEYINANTSRNKKILEERDAAARKRTQDEMRRTAEDRSRAREFLMKSSMIAALEAAAKIQ